MKNLIITFFLCLQHILIAQDGTRDLTFGNNGRVDHDYTPFYFAPLISIEQADGKILATAPNFIDGSKFVITRYLINGAIDTSYGINGLATFASAYSGAVDKILLQPDGKLLVKNYSIIIRFNENGTVDNSFGVNGMFMYNFYSCCIYDFGLQSDNKIIFAHKSGSAGSTLIRLNTNGTIDTSFGNNGFFAPIIANPIGLIVYKIVVQQDGKFLLNASDGFNIYVVARYNQNTSLDTSYGNNGRIIFNTPDGLIIMLQSDDKCLVGRNISGVGYISRFTTSGVLDSSFNNTGNLPTLQPNITWITGFKLQADNKLIWYGTTDGVIDYTATHTLLRFNSNGSIDTTFGTNGVVQTTYDNTYNNHGYDSLVNLHSGKILCLGHYQDGLTNPDGSAHALTVLERYNSSVGLGNEGFMNNLNIGLYPNPSKNTITITNTENIKEINIYNTLGQLLQNSTQATKTIDISSLQSGNYIIKIVTDNGVTSQKFIKE